MDKQSYVPETFLHRVIKSVLRMNALERVSGSKSSGRGSGGSGGNKEGRVRRGRAADVPQQPRANSRSGGRDRRDSSRSRSGAPSSISRSSHSAGTSAAGKGAGSAQE